MSVSVIPLGRTIVLDFVTRRPDTGAAADADSTPTAEVFEDANDTAMLTPTCVKRTSKTGDYRMSIACTTANGFEIGKSYNVVASATVNTVVAKAKVETFMIGAPVYTGNAITGGGGNTATIFATDRAETTVNFWANALLVWITGTLAGQVQKVSASGATGILTVSAAFTGTPANGDTFLLVDF